MSDLTTRYADAVMNTFGPPRLVLTRGEGAYVWDDQGNRYLDLLGGIAVNALGHGHPALVDAVTTQLRTLGHVSNFFATEPQVELAERLLALLGHPGHVFFTSSGTEANEAAFKLTRRTGRTHLVAAEGAFHGRTMGSLALTARPPTASRSSRCPATSPSSRTATWPPSRPRSPTRPPPSCSSRSRARPASSLPPDGYLAAARRITDDHGALLWLDEVQTGIGPHRGLVRPHRARASCPTWSRSPRGSAAGSPSAPASASARQVSCSSPATTAPPSAATRSPRPRRSLSSTPSRPRGCSTTSARRAHGPRAGLVHDHVTEVRGEGLLVGLDLDAAKAAAVARAALARGFIVNDCTPDADPARAAAGAHRGPGRRARGGVADDPRGRLRRGDSMIRHFLRDDDLTPDEQDEVLALAADLKSGHAEATSRSAGRKAVALIFDKPTLRTQVSFSAGVAELGGSPMVVDGKLASIGVRESISDTARVLGRQAAAIVWRTYGQERIEEMAAHAGDPGRQRAHRRVPPLPAPRRPAHHHRAPGRRSPARP